MLQRMFLSVVAAASIVALLSSCEKGTTSGATGGKRKHVAILKLGSHTLIDEVETAVFRSLKDHYGTQLEIRVYNANFEGDLLRQSVDQIASSRCDVVVPITTPASSAMVNGAPRDMPVVFSFVSNPPSLWGSSGTQPTNVTGTSDQIDYERNLRLIATLLPKASRLGYLVNESEEQAKLGLEQVKQIAPKYKLTVISAPVATATDVATAARSLIGQVDVFFVGGDNTVVSGVGGILSVAEKANIPVFAVERTSVEKGCVAAYGVDYKALGEKTAALVIGVLEGKKPSQLPVVYYRETQLYVNKAALQRAGLEMPKDVNCIY